MPKPFTEQIFRTTYRDDYADSDNYHRILFNSGRALQARELTQLQTILQREITRFGSNIFVEGAPVLPGGVSIFNSFEFAKVKATTPLPSNKDSLRDVIFTGGTSNVKVKILQAIDAENSDPETIYVQYLDAGNTNSNTTVTRLTPGETMTGTVGGSTVTFDIQTTNNASNPALGFGTAFQAAEGTYFVQGHFVFNLDQTIILSKYTQKYSGEVGFKITQDIVTSSDDAALFDNQGVTPNRSSPGADRYRIRLTLIRKEDVQSDENFIRVADIDDGVIVEKPAADSGFNSVRDFVATRNREISGNFIKKYFKAEFEPNDTSTMKLRVTPGIAYINGYRVEKKKPSTIRVKKPTATTTIDNELIPVDYGNFFVVSDAGGGKGMPNFDTCEELVLRSGSAMADSDIGVTRARAITEWQNGLYKLHVFDTVLTNSRKSLRDVRSIGVDSNTYYNTYQSNNQSLFEVKKKKLIFDTPINRPKVFSSISLTGQRKFSIATDTSGNATKTLTTSGEAWTNTGDWVVASATDAFVTGYNVTVTGGGVSANFTGLDPSATYEVAAYVRKGNASIRTKSLEDGYRSVGNVAGGAGIVMDSDGDGNRFLPLQKSDIYEVSSIRQDSAEGKNVFTKFKVDTGITETHYDDGRLYYRGVGLDSDNAPVYCKFKYFSHGNGDFFAVNSYTGQVDYKDIPAQRLSNGRLISMRDVIDFRPSTNGTGSFGASFVNELPQPTDLVELDAEYYLPRNDKLVLTENGELQYLTGVSDLQPQFPKTPNKAIDLYKFQLNANTLHTKDLTSRLLPMKGYTMADIGKLEAKLDKVEEMATLSLLELATQSLKSLDSGGVDRTKAGFFVDNFSNHLFTDSKNREHRASIDPRDKLMRPDFTELSIDYFYDSARTGVYANTGTELKGDLIMLEHTEVDWLEQGLASRIENLNPFHVERVIGTVTLSPSSDFWRETEIAAPKVIDQGTILDTSRAQLWNEHEWGWGGTDLDDLQVGASVSQVTGTSTTTTVDTSEPRLTGQAINEDVGDWVVTGTTSSTTSLGAQEEIVSQSSQEVTTTDFNDFDPALLNNVGNDFGGLTDEGRVMTAGLARERARRGGDPMTFGGGTMTIDTVTTTTTETREQFETVDTTTREQTTTTTTENEWTTDTTTTTATSTTTTVNRVAGEHTVREVVGTKIIDVITIPFMRSRVVSFRATGMRPNTRYFPFFDQTLVEPFCKNTSSFVRHSKRNPETRRTNLTPAVEHSDGTSIILSDANGTVNGEFEIPNNSAMRFRTGVREFALLDISAYNMDDALSSAVTQYEAVGHIDVFQDTVHSTRVLEIVGNSTTSTNVSSRTTSSVDTETLVETSTATDVDTETTTNEVVTSETTEEITDSQDIVIPPITIFQDPLAQTFAVDDPNGIYLTKVRVYFAEKDAGDIPCQLHLRPTVNGAPSADHIIPGSKVDKVPSQVTALYDTNSDPTLAEMLAAGTDFEFEEPIYLQGGTECSVVLISSSMDYKVFISQVEDFHLGSTEKRITKQPYLGSLFKSQNSRIWEPAQTQDLAFKMFRADFVTSGNAYLENVRTPPKVLTKNPFRSTAGSNDIRVFHRNHGLRRGDTTTITGLDSATYYNGLLGSDIMGNRSVVKVDGTGYIFDADSSANVTGRFGGGKCTGSANMTFDRAKVDVMTMKPKNTNLSFSGKFLTNSSLVDSDQGRYTQDAKFFPIKNGSNFDFNSPRMIANRIEETSELGAGGRSHWLQVNMTTTDSRVSPVIDLQRAGLHMIGNLIDKQDSASTDGFNVPISYVPESDPFYGSALAKHLTSPVTLEEDAFGIKVIMAANVPSEAEIQLWYRIKEEDREIKSLQWNRAYFDDTPPKDTNPTTFREYRATIGGFGDENNLNGGNLPAFREFQLKIVMNSTNSAKVPIIRDLRAITLAV